MVWTPPTHEFQQISQNVYFLTHGDHDRPAIGVIVGSEATMLVDAGNSNHHANVVMDYIRTLTQEREISPIRYVILTHWHWDHSFGAIGYEKEYKKDPEKLVGYPVIIGHHETTGKLKEQQGYEFSEEALQHRVDNNLEIEFIQTYMKQEYPDLGMIDIRTPKLSFQKDILVNLGDLEVKIEHVGGDHSTDSSLIYVEDIDKEDSSKKIQILFLGDCLYPNLYDNRKYTVSKIKKVLAKLSEYTADIYIDAHDVPWSPKDMDYLIQDFHNIIDYLENEMEHETELKSDLHERLVAERKNSEFSKTEWEEIHEMLIEGFFNGLK